MNDLWQHHLKIFFIAFLEYIHKYLLLFMNSFPKHFYIERTDFKLGLGMCMYLYNVRENRRNSEETSYLRQNH